MCEREIAKMERFLIETCCGQRADGTPDNFAIDQGLTVEKMKFYLQTLLL